MARHRSDRYTGAPLRSPPPRALHLAVARGAVFVSAALFCLLASSGNARAQPQNLEGQEIRKITFRGLKRLSEAEISAQLKLRLGQPYRAREVNDETGRLWRRGVFSKVEPKVTPFENGVEIIFEVEEKLRILGVGFEAVDVGSRKTSLSVKVLREAVSSRPGGLLGPVPYSLRIDTEQIAQAYRDKGYLFVEVDHDLKTGAEGAQITFKIKEGPRVRIANITFEGNKAVSDSTLRAQMLTKQKDWFFGFFNPGYYKQSDLERDVDRLKTYYSGLGFMEVVLAVDEVEFFDRNERMNLRILVEEGPRYTFEGYQFQGNNVFSDATLGSLVREKPGGFFSLERMLEDRAEILKYYRDRAYIDVRVDWEALYEEKGTTLQVLFNVREGHEIFVDRVHIRGNTKTQDRVIRRELEFYPGEKFNGSALEKSRSNLARLQIFQEIEYDLAYTAADRKDVVVKITEQPTGRLLLGFGVTSGFGIIGNFAVTKRNFDFTDLPDSIYNLPDSFTGAGQTLNIVLQPGTERSLYQFSFTEPYLFESRNSLTLEASSLTILRSDFDEDRLSFRPSLGHAFDFDRDLVFTIGSRLEEVEISNIDFDASPDVFEAEGHTSIVAFNTGLAYNKVLVEPLEGPYDGHRETITYEYGGEPFGGDIDFNKIQGSLDLYFPIYVHEQDRLHHVIALSSRAGFIEGHHNTDEVPIFERFFLGGPNTVRGFRFRGLGPQYRGDALGGSAAWYGNVEYIFPLFQKFVRGVLFLDYGNLASTIDDFDLGEMRFTVGAGVRINFPFLGTPLPVGLYFGEAIVEEDDDRTQFFQFTIGARF